MANDKKNIQMQVYNGSGYDELCPVPAEHASSHGKGSSDPITPESIGAAASSHTHAADNITSGTLNSARLPTVPVSKGGTGKTTLTSGSYLVGNGTSAVTLKTPAEVLSNIGAAASNHNHGAQSINPSSIELNPGTSVSHGGYIDFHYKGSASDYTSRIIEDASGQIRFEASAGVMVPTTYDIGTATVRNIWGGTTDLVAGSTEFPTGCIYLVYE